MNPITFDTFYAWIIFDVIIVADIFSIHNFCQFFSDEIFLLSVLVLSSIIYGLSNFIPEQHNESLCQIRQH